MKSKGISVTAGVLALVLLALGLVMQNQSSFSNDYTSSQLKAHGIYFTPVANLMPSQQKVPCLVANAGKPLLTGKQAECYALYQIGIDLTVVDHGKTYFQDHYNGYLTRVKMYAALAKDPNAKLPATQAIIQQSQKADTIANDLLAGEATKGLLLTAYGFSVLGDRAGLAALVCFIFAGLALLTSVGYLMMSMRRRVSKP